MPDVKRMIGEVAAENGIGVEPGDPLFALVTMNRMVLEESANRFYEYNQKLIAEFNASMKKAETHGGGILAQMVKESAAKMREGLQSDIEFARRSVVRCGCLVCTLFPLAEGSRETFSPLAGEGGCWRCVL